MDQRGSPSSCAIVDYYAILVLVSKAWHCIEDQIYEFVWICHAGQALVDGIQGLRALCLRGRPRDTGLRPKPYDVLRLPYDAQSAVPTRVDVRGPHAPTEPPQAPLVDEVQRQLTVPVHISFVLQRTSTSLE